MIDLHIHTTASDGLHTPAEILQKCEAVGLEMIAISDHFSMAGYQDLKDPSVRALFSGKILPACEFSAHYRGAAIEVLGYGIDPDAATPYITEHFPPLRDKQRLEMEHLIILYKERGFIIDADTIRRDFETDTLRNTPRPGRDVIQAMMMQYPENRKWLTDPLAAENNTRFLRNEVNNPESPFFRPMEDFMPDTKEICDFIHSLGGKAIIAHPGIYHPKIYAQTEEIILNTNPDGLEIWHRSHTPEQREEMTALCKKYNLIFSGGSDYHMEKEVPTLGLPHLRDLFPTQEILNWAEQLLLV